jgi:hypothetical protein
MYRRKTRLHWEIEKLLDPGPTLAQMSDRVFSPPKHRRLSWWELPAMLIGCLLVWAVFLLALPFALTGLGVLAPFAALGLLLHRLWKVNRGRR